MEHIHNIEIKNFKSIRHALIDGCRRVNVFIGAPNVGKSNILEALSTFSVSRDTKNISDFIRIKEPTTLFFNGDINRPAEIALDNLIRMQATTQGSNVKFSLQYDRNRIGFEELDKSRNKISGQRIDVIGGYDIFYAPDSSFQSISISTPPYPIGLNEFEKDIRICKYEFKKAAASANTTKSWELEHPFGENIFNMLSSNSKLRDSIQEIFQPYNLELLYDNRIQAFTILKRTGAGIFSIPYELVADTIQRLIFYKTAISSNKESILLFEEPEAHMYPPYIAKFTSDMIYDENKNQYFITTHSPFVINDIMENLKKEEYAIYTVGYDKENGETLVKRLSDEELHEIYQYGIDLFLNLENYLPHEHKQ